MAKSKVKYQKLERIVPIPLATLKTSQFPRHVYYENSKAFYQDYLDCIEPEYWMEIPSFK